MEKKIFIGTSGYNYQHWKNIFYPKNLTPQKWLEFYTQHFNSVELNVTFYRLPQSTAFSSWYKRSPTSFRFVIKGSRFITHIKRLKECQKPLKLFFKRASNLKEKLVCILWQLPPSLKCDLTRLEKFIKLLKGWPQYMYSFEFRNQTWFNGNTYQLFENNNINLCIANSPSFPCYEVITSNFLYLRFHGGKILYGSEYSSKELRKWGQKTRKWLKNSPTLFAFFNNDAYGFAIKDALTFRELISERV